MTAPLRQLRAEPQPEAVTPETGALPHSGDRPSWTRRLAFIMLVRVIVFTLILGGTVAVNILMNTPERLGGPFITFLFIFIAGLYLLNIGYAVVLRLIHNLALFTWFQLSLDLLVAAGLVNFTGGSDSAFILLFLLSPIGAAVILGRRAAVLTALVGTALMALTVVAGYAGLLPTVPGQVRLPWEVSQGSIFTTLVINGGAMLGVAWLSGYLAEQLRSAAATVEEQRARLFDLAALNADIIRCLTTGLITVGQDGRVITLNDTAARLLGVDPEQARWEHLSELAPQLDAFVSGTMGVKRGELTVTAGGRERLLDVSVSPLNDHHDLEQGRIVNFQDITEQRRLERRAKHNEHLAALGRITAGIAHEIRNPLGSISTSLEMLRAGGELEGEDGALMEIALSEIDRCDRLITDLLEYARPRPPELKTVDLGSEIHSIINNMAILRTGESSPTIEVERAEGGLFARVDAAQLSRVIWNLARNAWEAGERQAVRVRVRAWPDQQVSVEVLDRGCGIPAEAIAQVFEPFFTTRDEGTGLGLATVHHIVQEHGGTVDVESEPGVGTTVRILLPRAADPGSS